jgi:hypothetical protein
VRSYPFRRFGNHLLQAEFISWVELDKHKRARVTLKCGMSGIYTLHLTKKGTKELLAFLETHPLEEDDDQ